MQATAPAHVAAQGVFGGDTHLEINHTLAKLMASQFEVGNV
jgi:hypothetical protein